MQPKTWIRFIKEVAQENGFYLSPGKDYFEISKEQKHSAYFHIRNNPSGYLEVCMWEGDDQNGNWGRAIYSLRTTGEVVEFCNILISSAHLRAKRSGEK